MSLDCDKAKKLCQLFEYSEITELNGQSKKESISNKQIVKFNTQDNYIV